MGFVTTHRWFSHAVGGNGGGHSGPQPPRAVLKSMIAECVDFLAETGMRPVRVELETWSRPPHVEPAENNALCARMRLEVEPGALDQPFATWFQWQHPRWEFSRFPFPDSITRSDQARAEMDAGE